ncbi:hypothetical protein B0T17DRAFT_536847 [Bombardia bombarda]|uniref:BTB domain-containing protein n=1 Tax=Bombardia bombarda TaxID=252184 RepID=A0AA40BY26_9PEZI|nr:hypothetical protein B0T17DRAFT_536847 [Bombardia bombarda]
MVRVVVGKEEREFELHKKLLCTTSAFFRENLESVPSSHSSSSASSPSSAYSSHSAGERGGAVEEEEDEEDDEITVMWLPDESPQVFELFVLWLYQRRAFQSFIDEAIRSVSPNAAYYRLPHLQNESGRRALRWNLVLLHLFAELIDLPALQDIAMDALQDMYLRCDWDISPGFIGFLYRDCDMERAVRLRKWAVAMLGWTLHGGERGILNASQFERLFSTHPKLLEDYCIHLEKMRESKADIRIKNPQLRLPVNKLRNEERYFGFRQCSFHSHRAAVGQGTCPHTQAQSPSAASPRRKRAKDEMEIDGSDAEHPIISPVRDMNDTSFLDLS